MSPRPQRNSRRTTTSTSTVGRLWRYLFTGGSAALVDVGVFAILHPAFMSVPVAASCSFGVAAVENYAVTSKFVYKQPLSLSKLLTFFLFSLIGLLVNVGCTTLICYFTNINPVLGKLFGIAVAFLVNFIINNFLVFRAATVDDYLI